MVARTGLFVAPLPGSTPAGTSPTDGRIILGTLYGTGGGCLGGGTMTASGSAMQVTVATSVWRIPDPTNTFGVYLSPADPYTFTFSAGPASGSRIDVMWVRQNNYEAGDADSRVTYGVAVGTAATTPVAPSIPAGAMQIATITVPTSAANAAACTIVQTYGGQGIAYGPVSAASVAQLPTGQQPGQRGYVGLLEYRWSGTAWQLLTGSTTLTHLRWTSSTDPTAVANGWTDIPVDTVVYDPQGLRVGTGTQAGITTPWAGRWSFFTRAAVTADDTTGRYVLAFYNATASQIMSARGQYGIVASNPMEHYTEEVLAAGILVKPQLFRSTSGGQFIAHGSGQVHLAPEFIARYLGPA